LRSTQTPHLNDRLDALPFTKAHGRLLAGSGVGWAMDAMDVGLISFVIVQLKAQWSITTGQASWITAAGFMGMALGASVGGLLADRFGRRHVFALTLLIYGLATGASALAGSVALLVVLRFVVGAGLGAELPVASTLVSEFSPPRLRGRIVVWLEAFWAVGWTLAALIGYYVVPRGDTGWRWALALGALPALYAVVVRRTLPESVRFSLSRGRFGEAEAAVRVYEASAGIVPDAATPVTQAARHGVAKDRAQAPAEPLPGAWARLVSLWTGGMARRTAAIWTVWFTVNFAYYGAFIWLPTILNSDGASVTKSLQYTLIITLAQLPGYAAAALAIEKWGRRLTLTVFLAGSVVAAAAFSQAGSPGAIIAAGMALSFFNLGAWGALYAVTPEIYPTLLRGTGAGWAAGFGRIASVATVFLVPVVHNRFGTTPLFVMFAAAFAIAAAAAWALPEMRGKALEG
jgi:putative MFS transporter